MAYDVPSYLKRDGEALVFNKDKQQLIFYVPEQYFTTNNAMIIGEFVSLFGLLDFMIVDDKGKPVTKLKPFTFPSVFLSKPSSIEKIKEYKITKYAKAKDYRLLKFNKGDQVVVSVNVPQDISTVEAFYNLFNRGNLTPSIPYDKMVNIYLDNMALSGNKYGITAQLFGILYSEVYRDANNLDRPFRLSGSDDMLAYQTMPITETPKRVSPYVSLTSENWDNSVIGAIQLGDKGKDSPLEGILTGDIK